MTDRISFAHSALAAVYASPLMALPMVMVSNWGVRGVSLKMLVGPLVLGALMLWIPTVLANVGARALVGWLGSGLAPAGFHIATGLLAAALLVWIIDLLACGSAGIGGGPLGWPLLGAVTVAALCNAGMIYAVWHFGWKSTYD
jgi:hypothetical protein